VERYIDRFIFDYCGIDVVTGANWLASCYR